MNDEMKPTEYMILFRSTDWNRELSPEEMQKIMEKTYAWFDGLKAAGKFKAAQPLFHEGRVIKGRKGATITDGPFAESKEAVGGYLIVHAVLGDLEARRERPAEAAICFQRALSLTTSAPERSLFASRLRECYSHQQSQ